MSDQLTDLLRERFNGHAMDVPPGAWEHVSGQLAANASGESLRESLQSKFHGHEVEADPSAWANISMQLGHGAAAGSSFNMGWIAAGAAAVAVTATLFVWNNGNTEKQAVNTREVAHVVVEAPAPVSAPAATLSIPADTGSTPNMPTKQPTPVRAEAPAAHQRAQRHVTSTPPRGTKPEIEASGTGAAATASTPAPEHVPVAVQPISATTVHGDPVTKAAPGNDGTNTPETRPEVDPTGTSATSEAQVNDQPEEDPFHTAATTDIFIPNVFSPQGDGVNDRLEIVAKDYEKVDVRVFAAKGGVLVFRSNDLSNMWDGRLFNGNIAEEGYYKCVVLLTDINGRLRVKSEVVRLFR